MTSTVKDILGSVNLGWRVRLWKQGLYLDMYESGGVKLLAKDYPRCQHADICVFSAQLCFCRNERVICA